MYPGDTRGMEASVEVAGTRICVVPAEVVRADTDPAGVANRRGGRWRSGQRRRAATWTTDFVSNLLSRPSLGISERFDGLNELLAVAGVSGLLGGAQGRRSSAEEKDPQQRCDGHDVVNGRECGRIWHLKVMTYRARGDEAWALVLRAFREAPGRRLWHTDTSVQAARYGRGGHGGR